MRILMAGTPLLVFVGLWGGRALLRCFMHWVSAVPVAHAWNPDSHDKMTSYALELLRQDNEGGRQSLLGWVLEQYGDQPFFALHFVAQLRRGSVDEDMNSDIYTAMGPFWTRLDYATTGLLTALLVTGALVAAPAGLIAAPAALIILTYRLYGISPSQRLITGGGKRLDRGEALEGTNGGYHFYNPYTAVAAYEGRSKGLSDPTLVGILLRKGEGHFIEGTADVMPSALQRAFQDDVRSREWWQFDLEKRNYTRNDADRYYARGYVHLSAYAVGRVLHLLQDMAVPAHVRDDSHLGIGGDNSEPLEYYAADQDWESHFGTEALSDVKYRWSFFPHRRYDPHAQHHHFDRASHVYRSDGRYLQSLPFESIFTELAGRTHKDHYSYGTIPGNADSHNPNEPAERPWLPRRGLDFSKCRPNVQALIEVFNLNCELAMQTSLKVATVETDLTKMLRKRPVDAKLGEFRRASRSLILRMDVGEIPQVSTMLGLLDAYEEMYQLVWEWASGEGLTDEHLDALAARHTSLNLPLLRTSLEAEPTVETALRQWISASDPSELARVYAGVHGPCCIANHEEKPRTEEDLVVLKPQYDQCESHAIAYTAAFLAKWFEAQYAPGTGMGVELWINKQAPNGRQTPDLEAANQERDCRIGNGQQVGSKRGVFTLGVANALPADVDLELTVAPEEISENDRDFFEEGIPLAGALHSFTGGLCSSQVLDLKAKAVSVTAETLVAHLEKLRPYTEWAVSSLPVPEEGPSRTVFGAASGMGGIRREAEKERLRPVRRNLGALPPARGRDELTIGHAVVVRLAFGEGDLEEMPKAPSCEEPGPFPDEAQPTDIYGMPMER